MPITVESSTVSIEATFHTPINEPTEPAQPVQSGEAIKPTKSIIPSDPSDAPSPKTFRHRHSRAPTLLTTPKLAPPTKSTIISRADRQGKKPVQSKQTKRRFFGKTPVAPEEVDSSSARLLYAIITGTDAPIKGVIRKQDKTKHYQHNHTRQRSSNHSRVASCASSRSLKAKPSSNHVRGASNNGQTLRGKRNWWNWQIVLWGSSNRAVEARAVSNVTPKALSKLRKQLVVPTKQRKIISNLKKMEIPNQVIYEESDEELVNSDTEPLTQEKPKMTKSTPELTPLATTKVYTLHCNFGDNCTDDHPHAMANKKSTVPAQEKLAKPTEATDTAPEGEPQTLPTTTPFGAILSLAGSATGAFNLVADISGALIKSQTNRGDFMVLLQEEVDDGTGGIRVQTKEVPWVPDLEGITIFTYWWGFEILLPPAMISRLDSIKGIQSTIFTALQTLCVGGGIPELAPFIRYLSQWLDMEFAAIKSQDQGNGVVVAATWFLPVALVPRPWDFPIVASEEPEADA